MRVSVVIVNYYTGKFLTSLIRILEGDSMVIEIIIVNNSPAEILDEYLISCNKTKQIVNEKNEGFWL